MVFDGANISMTSVTHNVMTFVRKQDMLFAVSTWLCNNTVRPATSEFLCVFFKMADLSAVCVLQLVCLSVCQSVSQPVAFGHFKSGI